MTQTAVIHDLRHLELDLYAAQVEIANALERLGHVGWLCEDRFGKVRRWLKMAEHALDAAEDGLRPVLAFLPPVEEAGPAPF